MKYIKKVILKNFQSHKSSELEFDNGLNVIVGPSDQGKSAIIRGIKWALFNEPSGDYFIREGEKDCSVTLVFNDNTAVKRYRSKSKNLYYLYDAEGKETIFEGFGTNVPVEILDRINIKKIYLDGKQSSSINISDQLEGPFLLSEKTATRANAIGRLVGVHFVDDAVSDTLKDIRSLSMLKRNTEEQLNIQMEELEKYSYLKELEQTIEHLDFIKNKIKNLECKIERLKTLSNKLSQINKNIEEANEIITKLDKIEYISKIIKELNFKIKTYIFIDNRLKTLFNVNKYIHYNESVIRKIKDLDRVYICINELEQKVEKRINLKKINSNKKSIDENLQYNEQIFNRLKYIQLVDKNIESIDNQYKKLVILNSLRNNKLEVDNRIIYGSKYLDRFSKVDNIDFKVILLEESNITLNKLIILKDKKDELLNEMEKAEKILLKSEEETKILLLEYKKLLSRFEVCPLCLSKIDQSTIEKIVDTYK